MEQLVAVEAQPEPSKLVEEMRRSGQPLVITEGGERQAALVDITVFNRLMEDQQLEQQVDAMLSRLAERNKAFSVRKLKRTWRWLSLKLAACRREILEWRLQPESGYFTG